MALNATPFSSARLARWSQDGEARLTPEAAAEWLNAVGIARWLPVEGHHTPPAPSFLEAVVGRPAPVPSAGERARARDLLAQTVENSAAAPLRFSSEPSEQPEWIVGSVALRFIYALKGNRNFKAGPAAENGHMTPLAVDIWRAIEERGPQTASALQSAVGGDVSEVAVGRALHDLWTGLYVFPSLKGRSDPVEWELLSRRFPEPVAAGSCTSHAEAQSALISLYLHTVLAATEDEILAFLAPLAPQSKLREVIRHLGFMRELDFLDIGSQAHLCLRGEELPPEASREVQTEPEHPSRIERKGTSKPFREERNDARESFQRPQRQPAAGEFHGDRSRAPKFASERFKRGSRPGQAGDRARAYPPRPPSQGKSRGISKGPWRKKEREPRPYGERPYPPKWRKTESGKPEFDRRPSREGGFERGPRRDEYPGRRTGRPEFRGKPSRDGKFKPGKPGARKFESPRAAEFSRPGARRREEDNRRPETGRQGKGKPPGGRKSERGREDSPERRDREPFWARNPRDRKAAKRKSGIGGPRGKRPHGGPPSRPRGKKK